MEFNEEEAAVLVEKPDQLTFEYDSAFGPYSTHERIYNECGADVVQGCLEGINGTVFVYGQTGSGKTYMMEGTGQDPGLIPRSFRHIFRELGTSPGSPTAAGMADGVEHSVVKVSYAEIYNEKIRDLLVEPQEAKPLRVREDNKGRRFFVEGFRTGESAVFEWTLSQKIGGLKDGYWYVESVISDAASFSPTKRKGSE